MRRLAFHPALPSAVTPPAVQLLASVRASPVHFKSWCRKRQLQVEQEGGQDCEGTPSHTGGAAFTQIVLSSKTNCSSPSSHIDLINSPNTISGLSKQDPQTISISQGNPPPHAISPRRLIKTSAKASPPLLQAVISPEAGCRARNP